MGPPVSNRQGPPAVPKMGVRARVSDWPQRRDAEPPPKYHGLLKRPLRSSTALTETRDLQAQFQETSYPLCDLLSHSPVKSLMRSNSEVTISDVGTEDLDPAAINPNTGATLRREYGSTSSLDCQSLSGKGFVAELREEEQPSAPPPLPDASVSQSLKTASQIAQGHVVHKLDGDYVDSSVFYQQDRRPPQVQRTKPDKVSIFSRLRSPRSDGDYGVPVDVRRRPCLTPQKCFSHYDAQSIIYTISEAATHNLRREAPTAASAPLMSGGVFVPAPVLTSPQLNCEEVGATINAVRDDGDSKSNSLVSSCSLFRNEIGGEVERNLGLTRASSATSSTVGDGHSTRCTNASVSVLEVCRENQMLPRDLTETFAIEHVDHGAKYYQKHFYNKEHQNYFGVDESLGPVSLSVRREKLDDRRDGAQYNYRIILRTSQLSALRGSILEDAVPSSSKHGTTRGLPLKDVLDFVVPELSVQCLHLASSTPRVPELLLQLDQQQLNFQRKVGVLFCRAGQNTEEEMYNNETSSPALDQFLDLLGQRVQLKGFNEYRAQLDTNGDSTGSHSVYTTYREHELMFHVSTLLPYTANDTQQLLRKRHIANDIVTVIFQEPDALPFSPQNIQSHFTRVFIVVRVHQPCSQHTCYSVAVSSSRDVLSFGPLIPAGLMFPASPVFRDFLLTKILNAEHAVHRSEKFVAMAIRSRQEHMKDLVDTFATSTPVDGSSVKFSLISLVGKKKECSMPRRHAHLQSVGALTWAVTARDFSHSTTTACRLAVSPELVVLIEESTRQVVFNCYCRNVIGWSAGHGGIKLFYDHGDCVMFSTWEGGWEEVREITQRLQMVTGGAPAVEMTLRRNRLGQLGFHVNFEGVVADVEAHGFAWQAGLRPGCRLMEICRVAVVTMSHEQMIEMLRTSTPVNVVVIPPQKDGTPRRSFSEIYRVPVIEHKLAGNFRVAPPIWSQVPGAPPLSRSSSNQSAGSDPTQQLIQSSQGSTFNLQEGSRIPQELDFSPSASFCCHSPSNRSTSSDPGPPVTKHIHAPRRSSGESEVRLDRTRSTAPVAGATLVLRDIRVGSWKTDCPDGQLDQGTNQTTSSSHVTEGSLGDLSEISSLSSDSRQSRSSSEHAPRSHTSANSPHSVTCLQGSSLGGGFNLSQETCPPEGEELSRSEGGCMLDDANRLLLLLTSEPQFSSGPIRDVLVRMMQCVTAGEQTIKSDSGVLPPSPWCSLTRTMSEDSLCLKSMSLTRSSSSLLLTDQLTLGTAASHCCTLPPHLSSRSKPSPQRNARSYSDSSLAERSKMAEDAVMSRPSVISEMNWSHLVDAARNSAGVFSSSFPLEVKTENTALQDSDITAASLSGKVSQLEACLQQLQLDLLKEQQDKVALQQQVQHLRQDNRRLQEESQSAAAQLKRFATFLLQRRT
ncbi:signal-induced proliferation-associated 1-like protein 2 [Aulostomus maculatus]